MCVARVEKNLQVGFLPQTLHESGKLARAEEISLSFGGANKYRNSDFSCSRENGPQQDEVSDIQVAEGRASSNCVKTFRSA